MTPETAWPWLPSTVMSYCVKVPRTSSLPVLSLLCFRSGCNRMPMQVSMEAGLLSAVGPFLRAQHAYSDSPLHGSTVDFRRVGSGGKHHDPRESEPGPGISRQPLVAGLGGISGYAKAGSYNGLGVYGSSVINLSDADPAKVPGAATPLARISSLAPEDRANAGANSDPASSGSIFYTDALGALFSETGSYAGAASQIATKLSLHDQNGQLHAGDGSPLTLTALGGGSPA